jgi:hypothetical protein
MAWVEKMASALKPGGIIILSTPNIDALSSRWKVLCFGFPKYFRPVPMKPHIFLTSGHIHPITSIFIKWACTRNKLEIDSVKTKSKRLPKLFETVLYKIFYSHFSQDIRALIKGSIAIYTIKKPGQIYES